MIAPKLKILSGAQELFMAYGFKAVTVDQIAAHIGMSKKTIYENFSDKSAIITAVLDRIDHEIIASEKKASKSAPNAIVEIMELLAMIEELFSKMNPVCILDMQKYHPECIAIWETQTDEMLKRVKKNIRRGIKEGLYRKTLDIDLVAYKHVQEHLYALANPTLAKQYGFFKFQKVKMELYLYSLATTKGHAIIEQELNKLKKKLK
jgi:AcrR family transcriptional regulator